MAHNKTYVVCENMCMEEGMTKDQINTLFKKQELKIFTVTLTTTTNNQLVQNKKVTDYIDGMTAENCFALPVKIKMGDDNWFNQNITLYGDGMYADTAMVKYLTDGVYISGRLPYAEVGTVVTFKVPIIVAR